MPLQFISTNSRLTIVASLLAIGLTTGAEASPPPDYGLDWVTVGAPGNAAYHQEPPGRTGADGRGAVAYEYRMTRTEITTRQWLEFVHAYSPYCSEPLSIALTSSFIVGLPDGAGGVVYDMHPQHAPFPVNSTFFMAARFANWLHNDKADSAAAFEQGAYDLSDLNGGMTVPPGAHIERSPDAKFWIPSQDEWMKAVYFDPDRDGQGQPGWWTYPNASDTPLISGPASEGGQTNAGLASIILVDAGQYPDSASPWGLLDASGGMSEWLDDPWPASWRSIRGSSMFSILLPDGSAIEDLLDDADRTGSMNGLNTIGFRLASRVPTPSGVAVLAMLLLPLSERRRLARLRRAAARPSDCALSPGSRMTSER